MEEKNKKNLELAVIFKSSQSENGLTLFIPQKIIFGTICFLIPYLGGMQYEFDSLGTVQRCKNCPQSAW